MRVLDAGQTALVGSPGLRLATLIKLTTYSDRTLGTVQATRYFSEAARLYKWAGGAVQQFEPWLVSATLGRETMNHLPSPDASGADSTLRANATVIVRNWLQESSGFLYPTLRAENLEFARIEIAVLFLESSHASWFDLSDLAGTEATWIFRGQIQRVSTVTDTSLTLECESELPIVPWLYITSSGNPEDVGRRVPLVYGHATKVRGVAVTIALRSTLVTAITSGSTSLEITDGSAWPTSGYLMLGSESIYFGARSGNTLSSLQRAQNGTSAASHDAGAIVAFDPDLPTKWVVAGNAASAIPAVYVISPFGGATVRILSSRYTANLSDGTVVAGRQLATVSISRLQMRQLISDLSAGTSRTIREPLDLFADVDGPLAPYTYASGYGFEEGTSWSVANGTQTDDTTNKTEGSHSQKLVSNAATFTAAFNNDGTDWTAWSLISGAATLSKETANPHAGDGALRVTLSAGSPPNADVARGPISLLVGGAMRLWVRLPTATYNNLPTSFNGSNGSIVVTVNQSGTGGYSFYRFLKGDFSAADTWTALPLDDAHLYERNSKWTMPGTVTQIDFLIGGTAFSGTNYALVDEFEYETPPGAVMQRNATSGTVDLTAGSNKYRLSIRGDSLWNGGLVRIYFSNTAGTGTTKPASYWKLEIPCENCLSGSFIDIDAVATGVGSPATPNNVETVGVELVNSIGSVWVDDLRRADSSISTPYSVAYDVLLEKLPDILRHFLTTQVTPAQTLDATWNDPTGAGYMDDDVFAGDVGTLGETLADILARIAFEGRCNVFPVERAAATTWQIRCASNAYAWPSAASSILGWSSFLEDGRQGTAIYTRFRTLYAWNQDRGGIDSAFDAVVQTTDATAEAKFGRIDAPPIRLFFVQDANTAAEIHGYYAQELARVAAAPWTLAGVSWLEAWALERGDIVSLTPPWSSTKKARIVEITRRPDQFADLVAVEVP